jgi:hypothetical protein
VHIGKRIPINITRVKSMDMDKKRNSHFFYWLPTFVAMTRKGIGFLLESVLTEAGTGTGWIPASAGMTRHRVPPARFHGDDEWRRNNGIKGKSACPFFYVPFSRS